MFKASTLLPPLLTAVLMSAALPVLAVDRAVIVGVNSYPYLQDGNLKGARGDALKFRDFVRRELGLKDNQIRLLLDRDATQDNVIKAIIKDLIRGTRPGDRAIFYFAGHGTRIKDFDGDEKDGKDEIIMLSDVGKKGARGILKDDEFRILFEKIPTRRVLLVVDSCHSGTITRSTLSTVEDVAARTISLPDDALAGFSKPSAEIEELPVSTASNIVGTRGRSTGPDSQAHMSVWTAVSQDQVALERAGEGVFTKNFIAGLRGKRADRNRNGIVSNAELLRFVREQSSAFCRRSKLCAQKNKGRLTPEFSGNARQAAALTGAPVYATPAPVPKPTIEPAPSANKDTLLAPAPALQKPNSPAPTHNTQVAPSPEVASPAVGTAPAAGNTPLNPSPSQDQKPTPSNVVVLTPPGSDTEPTATDTSGTIPQPNDPAPTSPSTPSLPSAQQTPVPQQDPSVAPGQAPTPLPNTDVADLQPDPPKQPVPAIPEPLDLHAPGQLTDMFLAQNDAGLGLEIIPGRRLQLGKLLRFELSAKSSGQLVLFDYNPNGELYQIFPSRFSDQDAANVTQGTVFNIPNAIAASGQPITIRASRPTGKGHLVALLLEDDITAITDLLPAHTNLREIVE